MAVCSGLVSPTESIALADEAKEFGIDEIIFSHPDSNSVGADRQHIRDMCQLGAVCEFCALGCLPAALRARTPLCKVVLSILRFIVSGPARVKGFAMRIWYQSLVEGGRVPSYFEGLAERARLIARPGVEVTFASMPEGVYGTHAPAEVVIYPYLMSLHIQFILDNALRALPTVLMDATFKDVGNAQSHPDALVDRFIATARESIERGAEAIIPGQLYLSEAIARAGVTRIDEVPIIDGLVSTLKMAEAMADFKRFGISVTRRGYTHARPAREMVEYARRLHARPEIPGGK